MKLKAELEARAIELLHDAWDGPRCYEGGPHPGPASLRAVIQFGREMADARAEEIARMCEKGVDDHLRAVGMGSRGAPLWLQALACIARSTITKPQTREQVLEEALRRVREDTISLGLDDTRRVIERALGEPRP